MPHDIEPVWAVHRNRLDNRPFWQRAMQVPQLAVDPRGHDCAVLTEEIESGGGRVRHSLPADATCCDGDGHAGHDWFPSYALALPEAPGKPRPGRLKARWVCLRRRRRCQLAQIDGSICSTRGANCASSTRLEVCFSRSRLETWEDTVFSLITRVFAISA